MATWWGGDGFKEILYRKRVNNWSSLCIKKPLSLQIKFLEYIVL